MTNEGTTKVRAVLFDFDGTLFNLTVGIPKGIHLKEELRGAGADKTIENLHELVRLLEV